MQLAAAQEQLVVADQALAAAVQLILLLTKSVPLLMTLQLATARVVAWSASGQFVAVDLPFNLVGCMTLCVCHTGAGSAVTCLTRRCSCWAVAYPLWCTMAWRCADLNCLRCSRLLWLV